MSEPHQDFAARLDNSLGLVSGKFRRYSDGRLVGSMDDKSLILGTMDDAKTDFVRISPCSAVYTLIKNTKGGYTGTSGWLDDAREKALLAIPEMRGIMKQNDVLDTLGRIEKSRIESHLNREAIEIARGSLDSAELDIWLYGAVTS